VGTSNGTTTTSVSPANSKVKKMKVEKEKDPNAPRKPANAFLMFCQQRRSVIQEEFFKVNCVGFFCCL
jgi:non-histone protein 10